MRKILVSLLVAAMVLGLVSSAFAGYSDTTGNADAKYIDKATAFSWMKGYPDGSFKPAGNITRAEFAAVVVRGLGLEAAAGSTTGLTTKFKDVASTHWGAGYINVAVNKGIIKGYPDGSFKPEANVTNAEAVTMVVRALNREADAVGEWPVGHITVAAANSIIGSGFASNALATRADVARYIAKASEVKFKELTTNGWVESADKTMIKSNNIEKVSGTVTATDTANKTITMDVNGTANTYTLDANYLIAGGISLLDIKGYTVDAFKNKDTSKVLFVEQSTTTTVKKGDIRAVGADWFYLYDDTTKYTVGTKSVTVGGVTETRLDATVVRNGATVLTSGSGASLIASSVGMAVDDTVTFFIGANGNVTYVNSRGYNYKRYIVTDLYTAGTPNSITIRSGATTATLTLASDCKVELNNVDAKFADIKKWDIVSVAVDPNNNSVATIINGSNKVVNGKITAKRMTVSDDATRYYISIDGVEYRFEGTSEVKDNESVYNTGAKIYGDDLVIAPAVKIGQTVAASLSQRGRIRVLEIVSGIADMGRIKRFVENTSGSYDSWVMDMKGTEQTYEVSKPNGSSMHSSLKTASGGVGNYVSLSLDNDGRINGVTRLVTIAHGSADIKKLDEVYSGDKIVTIGGIAYLVTNDTLLYVNDVVGSMASVTKNAYAGVAFTSGSVKLKALVVDTFAKMDTAAMVATTTTLKGYDKAAEYGATVAVYTDAAMATAPIGTATADEASGSVSGFAGGFSITFSGARSSGSTVYVKVTDKFGNITSAPIRIP